MLTNLDTLIDRLKGAEYAYLLLEPVPLFGLLFGLLFFGVGIFLKQSKCRILALLVIAATCGSVLPYLKYRNQAMQRVTAIREVSLPKIKQQSQLRNDTKWVYYGTAWLALLTLITSGRFGTLLNYGLLLVGTFVFVFSL